MFEELKRLVHRIRRASIKLDRGFYSDMKSADSHPAVDAYPAGSVKWLMATEKKYGGLTKIPITQTSPIDPRNTNTKIDDIKELGGNKLVSHFTSPHYAGGDRMLAHFYSPYYAKHLKRFVQKHRYENIAIAEVGVLSGIGLALWSDLFPNSKLFALDIDFTNFLANEEFLRAKGAFTNNNPTMITYDQFAEPTEEVITGLGGARLSIVIDDASHFPEGIMNTIDFMQGHLADNFVYFIEDNDSVEPAVREKFPHARVRRYGELTVIESVS